MKSWANSLNSEESVQNQEEIIRVLSGDVYGMLPAMTYVMDFKHLKYLYFSKNVFDYTGYPAEEFLAKGPFFSVNLFHPDDVEAFVDVQEAQKEFLLSLAPQEYKQYRFTWTYRFKRADGQYINVMNQEIVLQLDKKGNPLLSYGIISDVTHLKKDTKISLNISKVDSANFINNLVSFQTPEELISSRELEVLKLIMEGLSTAQIADKLFISPFTVKNHRRNMLTKTEAKNMAEVIRYATTKGLI